MRSFLHATFALWSTITAQTLTAQPAPQLRTVDPVVTTDVSGYRGQVTWVMLSAGITAMSGIEWREDSDKPCALVIGSRELRASGVPAPEYTPMNRMNPNVCPGGRHNSIPISSDNSKRVVHVSDGAMPGQWVRGIQVCSTSASNHRLKGIRIMAAHISVSTYNGGLNMLTLNAHQMATQQNCDVWRPAVYCPADHVASGVAVHSTDEEIVGLALRCRRVQT